MDGERFDRIAKDLGTGIGRRPLLRTVMGACLKVALVAAGLTETAGECRANGTWCADGGQCCSEV